MKIHQFFQNPITILHIITTPVDILVQVVSVLRQYINVRHFNYILAFISRSNTKDS